MLKNIIEIIFIFGIISIFYAYFGYPLFLKLVSFFKKKDVKRAEITPLVSYIITASNEEKRIKEKIENTLKLNYPKDKLEVIVASDGSTDKTNEIVQSYAAQNVILHLVKERKGKENAQSEAVKIAKGEIFVFSDVATILKEDAIQQIVSNFADSSVGCVSSTDKVIDSHGSVGSEGGYVKYEMWLRKLEMQVNSLVGLSGSFFAARREVCMDFAPNMQSDFRTLLSSIKLGLRGVIDENAVGYYKDLADQKKEFDRKVRTVIRGLVVFFSHLHLLNIFKYGFFSFQLFSHKLMRWLVPWFMILVFVLNLLLIKEHIVYTSIFIMQVLFYFLALVGFLFSTKSTIINIPKFFIMANYSILIAWLRFFSGEKMTMWVPSQR
jgi:cellulose synthase/poly-beta-1,6-N-acetylglucosamine synthase-like glycosyltransferase